jgi:hypothetical protein
MKRENYFYRGGDLYLKGCLIFFQRHSKTNTRKQTLKNKLTGIDVLFHNSREHLGMSSNLPPMYVNLATHTIIQLPTSALYRVGN